MVNEDKKWEENMERDLDSEAIDTDRFMAKW